MADTRWEDIYNHLSTNGFEVYSPGQKTGECIKPYVVVKDAGLYELNEISSNQQLFDVMCYVPADKYSTLDGYVDSVKDCMDGLFPMIRPVHSQTPSYLDDTVKAHMISVQYVNYQKKIRR